MKTSMNRIDLCSLESVVILLIWIRSPKASSESLLHPIPTGLQKYARKSHFPSEGVSEYVDLDSFKGILGSELYSRWSLHFCFAPVQATFKAEKPPALHAGRIVIELHITEVRYLQDHKLFTTLHGKKVFSIES